MLLPHSDWDLLVEINFMSSQSLQCPLQLFFPQVSLSKCSESLLLHHSSCGLMETDFNFFFFNLVSFSKLPLKVCTFSSLVVLWWGPISSTQTFQCPTSKLSFLFKLNVLLLPYSSCALVATNFKYSKLFQCPAHSNRFPDFLSLAWSGPISNFK